jgi:hypothetical protein
MVKFDIKTFAEATGRTGSVVDALGTTYGIPSCLMNLGKELLSMIPMDVLIPMRDKIEEGKDQASAVSKKEAAKLRADTGISEFAGDSGKYTITSSSSKLGADAADGDSKFSLGDLVSNINSAVTTGAQIYNNVQAAQAQVEALQECMDNYLEFLEYSDGNSLDKVDSATASNIRLAKYGTAIESSLDALKFQASAQAALSDIDDTITDRVLDPSLEPSIAAASAIGPTEEIFRLEAGPPQSINGKFILSVDGLYFDSQKDGLQPALIELSSRAGSIDDSNEWRLEYDPNLGGKGIPTTVEGLTGYFNTILDPKVTDDSAFLDPYYSQDVPLQDLIGQKNRRLYDLSGDLQSLISEGSSQALISNSRQVMISETSQFLVKINKRKKQIELAVKMPNIYGKGQIYAPGSIPVNDFSYLEGINFLFDVEQQRQITLKQDDVDSCVLPLETKFTQPIESDGHVTLNHLLVNSIGKASIIDDPAASSAASISINEPISEEGLFALYNLLTVKPSDTDGIAYGVFNGASTGNSHNAQLVGDVSSTFTLGLGVPYLKGVANISNTTPSSVSSMGSYIKLPEKKEFQDLLYTREGATFESWVHIPAFSSYDLGADASGLYRLLLANENTGLESNTSAQSDILNLSRNDDLVTTNGLLFGFTRDRRFTEKALPSNLPADNLYNDSVLVLAPTLSFDSSSAGFINSRSIDACNSASSWLGMTVPVSSTINGVSLSSCEDEFCHIVVTLDPLSDSIKYYLDGVSIATSSYGGVFGISPKKKTPKIPSVFQENSFRYDSNYVSESSVAASKLGPGLDDFFTPWIVGGGYTDGNPNGNFMGGDYGGKVSGLKGHVGSIKLYARPLTDAEVVINYTASKTFFKNIAVSGI